MAGPLPIVDPSHTPDGAVPPEETLEKGRLLVMALEPQVAKGVLVAFSGGVDSAFLLWAAARALAQGGSGKVTALTTTSPSTPERDRADALAFSERLGIRHLWKESREMALPAYARNDRDRCYHCKVELFRIASEVALEEGTKWLLYGFNASDREDDRPGHRAAQEAGARSPLADAGLTKAEIRFLMRTEGLPLAEKPASPCLSSRIMTGIEVTPKRLEDVEALERILREGGASTFRVRICRADDGAEFLRVEMVEEELQQLLASRERLNREGLKRGYRWVTLDLGGYRTGGGVR